MQDFRRLADEIAADIAAGRLRPGDRLPPQRTYARGRRIAPSTAIRVYGELVRRGLVVGEVGRGTFVRAASAEHGASAPPGTALTEGIGGVPINLELNYPVVAGQSELMARELAALARPDVLAVATRPTAPDGTPEARAAAAAVLARNGWTPGPERILFAGNGRQAIAGAISSLVPPGGRLGVETLTYPLVKTIAERLGAVLVPIATDAEGIRPDALATAHRTAALSAVYVQPTLHNPLALTAGAARRAAVAEVLESTGLIAVEDTTWAFLAPDAPAPLVAHAPERTLLVDSLSKRLAPGLTVGYLVPPAAHREALARALRSGGWSAAGFALAAATRWSGTGVVEAVVAAKRADAAARHRLVRQVLGGFDISTDPRAYFCWWRLPAPWRAETFVAAAAQRGIAVTPGSAFASGARSAPDAVRIGLASPPEEELARALRHLAALAS
ncbi:PLP-dependent aminotransferase family protein [Streptomyces sp. NPDC091376]|uniref:aminotransferase-like domain-containing protein n=1 Tax=Streptomyces sp. NPDC091376 TaxID=3365994 RepID=UPI003803A534